MRLSAQLRKGLKLGKLTYTCLQDFEFQKDYPLFKILMTHYAIEEKKEALQISIPLNQAVIKQNSLATHFWFDAILLYGDATKNNGLKSVDASSPPYAFNQKNETTCVLTLPLPKHKTPWLLLLKVGCIEGNEMGLHPKHYAMKVIRVSE